MSCARRRKRATWRAVLVATLGASAATACTDLSDYSTDDRKQYAGCVVAADFVLAGVSPMTEVCMTLDANQLQTAPGTISSTDGRFMATPLRPIPQVWSDPLSTFNFGSGRTRNLLYMASPSPDAGGGDVTAVVSLMENGGAELRLVRGAPALDGSDAGASPSGPIFAVVPMQKVIGGCRLLRASNCAPDAQPL
jgi:hypothetical protein